MSDVGLMVRDGTEQPKSVREGARTVSVARIEEHSSWPVLTRLPIAISAEVPVKRFCVRDVLGLQKGQIFETASPDTEDVPLMVGRVRLAWSEFEVVDRRLVVRLTRLA